MKGNLVKLLIAAVVGAGIGLGIGGKLSPKGTPAPKTDLERLQQGNERFAAGKPLHPHQERARRMQTAQNGQEPFAIVLTCSDSRVPPELIFDQGIGDLFVIRVAGNVCDKDQLATIEYGVEHLHASLLVVMGHTKCGAVKAALEAGKLEGALPHLIGKIEPVVQQIKREFPGLKEESLMEKALQQNVLTTIDTIIAQSQIVREYLHEKKLTIVGAIYDIETGKVEWLNPPEGENAHER